MMVKEELRELERVPEDAQLVIEEISNNSENMQFQDEWGIFLETMTQKCSEASCPAEVQDLSQSSLVSLDQLTKSFQNKLTC